MWKRARLFAAAFTLRHRRAVTLLAVPAGYLAEALKIKRPFLVEVLLSTVPNWINLVVPPLTVPDWIKDFRCTCRVSSGSTKDQGPLPRCRAAVNSAQLDQGVPQMDSSAQCLSVCGRLQVTGGHPEL